MTPDNDLSAVFDLALASEPPCADATAQVFAQAGRIRTRQRLAYAASGVTTAAVVLGVVLAASVYGIPGHRHASGGTAGLSVAAPAISATGKPSGNPGPVTTAEIPAAQMVTILTGLLPAGSVPSDPESQPGYAGLVLSDTAGRVKVEVNVEPGFNKGGLFDCATRPIAPARHFAPRQRDHDAARAVATDRDRNSAPRS